MLVTLAQADTVEEPPTCLADDRLCRWIWELTGNTWLAEASALAMAPLRIILILLLALLTRWLVRRAVNRLVRRAAGGTPSILRPLPERVRNTVYEATGIIAPARRQQRAEAIGSVLRAATTVVVFGIAGLLIFGELGIHLGPLLAGAGIVGVALGFGAQSLVRDVLSGLFMLLEDQYGVGDVVDLGEASGVVQAIGLRITTLRDISGTYWYVPNGEIRRVGNRSQGSATVIVDTPIGFAPVEQAITTLLTAAEQLTEDPEFREDILESPQILGVDQVTVEGAVVRTIIQTTSESQWRVGRELRRRQTQALEDAGLAAMILAARVYPRAPGGAVGGR